MGTLAPMLCTRTYFPEFREHGLLSGTVLIKWRDIDGYHWSAHDENQLVIRVLQPRTMLTIPISPEIKPHVVEILKRMVPAVQERAAEAHR